MKTSRYFGLGVVVYSAASVLRLSRLVLADGPLGGALHWLAGLFVGGGRMAWFIGSSRDKRAAEETEDAPADNCQAFLAAQNGEV